MTISESERLTRRQRIDPRVKHAGWTRIVPFRPDLSPATLSATAVEEYETVNGPADSALCDGGRILGVILTEFLHLALATPQLRVQIELPARSTSGVHNINSEEVRGLGIPLPPLDEQKEIVLCVSRALDIADRISQVGSDLFDRLTV